jgi:hypothetical protein
MPSLRKATAVVAVAATLVAGFPASPVLAQPPVLPASATPTAAVDPAALIGSTVKAFPHGGEPLKLAISDLVVQHPDLAAAVANYLRTEPSLTPRQRQAIADGLSDAFNRRGVGCAGPYRGLTKAPPADCGQGGEGWTLSPVLIALLAGGLGAGIWALTSLNQAGPPPAIPVSPN